MRVSDLIRGKGDWVATIPPDTLVAEAVAALSDRGIGALVVSSDGSTILGIVSERDVVRSLAERGPVALDATVAQIMTTEVRTCVREDGIGRLMAQMTEHRIRHLPVVENGALRGLVSIGDVVKGRLSELEAETQHLTDYISSGR
ncbi:MAG: CBS domain-containing protein [Microthrixaceae bacterium]|jgi:CBS domain-containing protein|nr:CBS domain-containing protein [Actinomycetota bacterium]